MWEDRSAKFLAANSHYKKAAQEDSFKLSPEVRAKLYDEFCKVDTDGMEGLSPDELTELFSRLALDVSDEVRSQTSTA